MTPVYLNLSAPSFPLTTGQKQDQNQLFDSPNNQDSTSSISCPSFFNILDQRQTRHDQEAVTDDSCNKMEDEESRSNSYRSSKWMCSEMRADSGGPASDKASNICTRPRWQHEGHRIPSNSNNSNRVCADCSTTSTPLWRSGPKGPKSLCNACGIRQRKARRATAEAANGLGATMDTKTRVHKNKENKSRANHFAQFKNKGKSSSQPHQGETRKLGFKDFSFTSAFQQVFPRDEAVEAALLLMDLSSGFIHF